MDVFRFAEFNKSRAFPISKYAKKRPGKIDVFRPVSKIVYSNGREIIFNDVVARNITCLAEHLVGESYGYSILYKLFARLIPGFNSGTEEPVADGGAGVLGVCMQRKL